MGLTGVIFAAIAALWLVFLVPYFLHQRGRPLEAEGDGELPLVPTAVTIVRSGTSLAEADEGVAEVSTPLTRRAQLRELKMIDQLAAQRRRRVLMVLLLAQLVVSVLAALGVLLWWSVLIPAALLAAFVVVARFSVRTMRADLERRAEQIRGGVAEETVALALDEGSLAGRQHSVALSGPLTALGSLWDPVPITRPTYVSTPLAPRTVRTIDLSAPLPPQALIPVTADAPEATVSDDGGETGRAAV